MLFSPPRRQSPQHATPRAFPASPSSADNAAWWTTPKAREAVPLTKENFDDLARMLCSTCRAAEEKLVALPPAVAVWWKEHKARDGHPEELKLDHNPGYAGWWQEYEARVPPVVVGVNHLDAIRALGKKGFRVLRQGKHVVLTNGEREVMIPRKDPVNPYAMGMIVRLLGLTEAAFRELL